MSAKLSHSQLSHLNERGEVHMVDVSAKRAQKRTAIAVGEIKLSAATLALIAKKKIKKGNVLTTAQLAGIMAAKQTQHLIPLCHTLSLSAVNVEMHIQKQGIRAEATATCVGSTGVEMEALTAVSLSLLTIYDMCKAVDKKMQIGKISLIKKMKEDI